MKTMTCKQLGGACDLEFHANTFEEMAGMSKKHASEMHQRGEKEHIAAMKEMMKRMNDHGAMKQWMDSKKKEFDALPKNNLKTNRNYI